MVAGCTSASSPQPSPSSSAARISVQPEVGLANAPVDITVSGLAPNSSVTVRITSVDEVKKTFASEADFRADSRGNVDVANASASNGSYTGVDPMGLLWSLQPIDVMEGAPPSAYVYAAGTRYRMPMTVTALVGGRTVATHSLTRILMAGTVTKQDLRTPALYADYFSPPTSTPRGAALVMFDGSSGGLDSTYPAALLASHGYRVLDLAYFKEPGLPSTLLNIPLEYFQRALEWLASQPGVDPSRIAVSGGSRGSEAALLLGVHDPTLVHGVMALSPNDAALCSYPGCAGPAWTLAGVALPYTKQFNNPAPTDNPAALIPVEAIHGPILMDCGQQDATWVSCQFAAAIQARLQAHAFSYSHTLLSYPKVGHGIANFVPYVPSYGEGLGGYDLPQAAARVDQWQHILQFLESLGSPPR